MTALRSGTDVRIVLEADPATEEQEVPNPLPSFKKSGANRKQQWELVPEAAQQAPRELLTGIFEQGGKG